MQQNSPKKHISDAAEENDVRSGFFSLTCLVSSLIHAADDANEDFVEHMNMCKDCSQFIMCQLNFRRFLSTN